MDPIGRLQAQSFRRAVFFALLALLALTAALGPPPVSVQDPVTTVLVSVATDGTQGNAGSYASFVSADGRYVAFVSEASNLVSGDTNGQWDVFIRNPSAAQTTRVSVHSNGSQGNGLSDDPAISAYGRYVAFQSAASDRSCSQ